VTGAASDPHGIPLEKSLFHSPNVWIRERERETVNRPIVEWIGIVVKYMQDFQTKRNRLRIGSCG
jgi:hypothetical protein